MFVTSENISITLEAKYAMHIQPYLTRQQGPIRSMILKELGRSHTI